MTDKHREKIGEIVKLCQEKIGEQRKHESSAGYGEDYNDGRVVGGACLARRILFILKDITW